MKNYSANKIVMAFGPASIGNVAVGFDLLGQCLEGVGDYVQASLSDQPGRVRIQNIEGIASHIPRAPTQNTAGAAVIAMIEGEKLNCGIDLQIFKGIPLGSGMGGSAASAVAGVLAASALVKKKISNERLLEYALVGEKKASGSAHPDNIAPCLYGGLTLAHLGSIPQVVQLSVPKGVHYVLVHPDLSVETKHARKILTPHISLQDYVNQSNRLARFILACSQGSLAGIKNNMADLIIEPQRKQFIPGFSQIQAEVLADKACLGFSISGSGPSVFGWATSAKSAERIGLVVQDHFRSLRLSSEVYLGKIPKRGAYILSAAEIKKAAWRKAG